VNFLLNHFVTLLSYFSVQINTGAIMKELTMSQLILLLSVWRLEDNAYGVTMRKELERVTGRKYPYGTLYSLLDQLYRKGFVDKSIGEPTRRRGGRRKILYHVTQSGREALQTTRELQNIIWKGIPRQAFIRK
jgi:DNA-binding PadR family transcriptional regulator